MKGAAPGWRTSARSRWRRGRVRTAVPGSVGYAGRCRWHLAAPRAPPSFRSRRPGPAPPVARQVRSASRPGSSPGWRYAARHWPETPAARPTAPATPSYGSHPSEKGRNASAGKPGTPEKGGQSEHGGHSRTTSLHQRHRVFAGGMGHHLHRHAVDVLEQVAGHQPLRVAFGDDAAAVQGDQAITEA